MVYAQKLSLNDCFFIFRPFPPHDFQLLNGPLNYSVRPSRVPHFCFAEKRIGSYSALFTDQGWSKFDCYFSLDFAPYSRAIWIEVDGTFYVHAICRHVCMLWFVETWPISLLLFNVTSLCFGLLEYHMLFVVTNFRLRLSAEFLFNTFLRLNCWRGDGGIYRWHRQKFRLATLWISINCRLL